MVNSAGIRGVGNVLDTAMARHCLSSVFGQRDRWHLNDMPATPAIAGPAESHGRYSEPSLFSLLGREA
jgi:hypothetical protein